MGFGVGGFDSFLSMTEPPPVPQSTPAKIRRGDGGDDFDNDDEDKEMSVTIRYLLFFKSPSLFLHICTFCAS